MSILSPFRYAGAKNRLLPILGQYLIPFIKDSYCEPFVGGGSVVLHIAQKFPNISLYINDKDSWISSFWGIIASDYNKLVDLLELLDQPATMEQFDKLNENPANSDVERAYRAVFYNRTCFSGIVKRDSQDKVISNPIGGKKQLSKYKVDCRYNASKIKEKIINCHKLLSGRTIVDNLDIKDYLPKIESNLFYLDPPYVKKGNALYHEVMTLKEHKGLAELLKNKQNWVLSYDDCEEIRNLYANNKIIDINAAYSITSNNKEWVNKKELLIIKNGILF